VLEEGLEDPEGVGVKDRRDVAGAELLGGGGVLAAAPDPPLAKQLAVRQSAGWERAVLLGCRVVMSLGSVVLS
jgi:hypothetical protein